MPSQVGPHEMAPRPNRRRVLAGCLAWAGSGCLGTLGCVPNSQGPLPELVWGRRGLSEGRFLKPRAITIDALDQLYIVDTTGRIQVFDTDGNLIRWWKTPQTKNGRPTGLAIRTTKAAAQGGSHKDRDDARVLVADTHYYRMLSYTLEGELRQQEQIGGTAGHGPGEFAFVTDAVSDRARLFLRRRVQCLGPHSEV